VETETELVPAGVPASFLRPVSPPLKKAAPALPATPPPIVEQVAGASEPPHAPEPAPPSAAAISPDAQAWESLLASIKQELKNAAHI
jgi:hypothetical protein